MVSPSPSCSIVFFFPVPSQGLGIYLFSLSFIFNLWLDVTAKSTVQQVFFLLLTITRFGRLVEIRWSVCISKSQRIFCVSFSWTDSGLCISHFVVWSNLNFLHNSQWITLAIQSCLVLYSFCSDWSFSLYYHITYLAILSFASYLFLVLMALFCAAIRRDSVSLLRFPFLSPVQVSSYEISHSLLLLYLFESF